MKGDAPLGSSGPYYRFDRQEQSTLRAKQLQYIADADV
jgi:hypothetical protein